jgi:hypothetical protein
MLTVAPPRQHTLGFGGGLIDYSLEEVNDFVAGLLRVIHRPLSAFLGSLSDALTGGPGGRGAQTIRFLGAVTAESS